MVKRTKFTYFRRWRTKLIKSFDERLNSNFAQTWGPKTYLTFFFIIQIRTIFVRGAMAQATKEPCKKEACDIQACLSKNNFLPQRYAPLTESLCLVFSPFVWFSDVETLRFLILPMRNRVIKIPPVYSFLLWWFHKISSQFSKQSINWSVGVN